VNHESDSLSFNKHSFCLSTFRSLAMSLSLNCLVIGDDPDRAFTVEIPRIENVSTLKKLIKQKKAPHLDRVAASDLDLWQVSFPIDDLPSKHPPIFGPKLRSEKLLLGVFPSELDINHVHVFAHVPHQGEYYIDSSLIFLIIPSGSTLSWFRAAIWI